MGFDLLLETLLEQKRAFNKKTVKKKTWIDIKVTFVMHIITEVKQSGEIWVFVYSAVKYTVTGCDRLFSFSICCCSDILIRRSHGWTCRLDLVSTHTQTLTTHTHITYHQNKYFIPTHNRNSPTYPATPMSPPGLWIQIRHPNWL